MSKALYFPALSVVYIYVRLTANCEFYSCILVLAPDICAHGTQICPLIRRIDPVEQQGVHRSKAGGPTILESHHSIVAFPDNTMSFAIGILLLIKEQHSKVN